MTPLLPLDHHQQDLIDWHSFLGRPRLPKPASHSLGTFRDASILITGAAGSIGSALSLRIAEIAPRRLLLLDSSEQAMYCLRGLLSNAALLDRATLYLGSVNDRSLLDEICSLHRPDLIFHAAAYKHLPLLEEQPLAAIETNSLGTLNLVESVNRQKGNRRCRIILLSTDKAADPTSILGASKRLAERIVIDDGGVAVRLTNVLGSNGSVVQSLLTQIDRRQPLTITHSDAERFFITREEAVDLLLSASAINQNGSLVVPAVEMPHKVAALADFLVSSYSIGWSAPISFTGLRPGEKMNETLWSRDEHRAAKKHPASINPTGFSFIDQPPLDSFHLRQALSRLVIAINKRGLIRAIEIVSELIPTYTLSETILRALPAEVSKP